MFIAILHPQMLASMTGYWCGLDGGRGSGGGVAIAVLATSAEISAKAFGRYQDHYSLECLALGSDGLIPRHQRPTLITA